jgi:hypothetical protein
MSTTTGGQGADEAGREQYRWVSDAGTPRHTEASDLPLLMRRASEAERIAQQAWDDEEV